MTAGQNLNYFSINYFTEDLYLPSLIAELTVSKCVVVSLVYYYHYLHVLIVEIIMNINAHTILVCIVVLSFAIIVMLMIISAITYKFLSHP